MSRIPPLLLLLACGPTRLTNVETTDPETTFAVATPNDLPACDDDHRGALYYVEDTDAFMVCRQTGWKQIDLHGPRGATGTTGTTGAPAPTGSLIAASIYCSGLLPGIGLTATYDAAVFRSGDVYVKGSIYGLAFELSATNIYAAQQNGALTGSVILTYDVEGAANGGWFQLELNRTTLVQTVIYTDADSPGGKRTWTKPASECIVNIY